MLAAYPARTSDHPQTPLSQYCLTFFFFFFFFIIITGPRHHPSLHDL